MTSINIFSGARRIASIAMLAWGVVVLAYFAQDAYYQALAEERLVVEASAKAEAEAAISKALETAKIRARTRERLAALGNLRRDDLAAIKIEPKAPLTNTPVVKRPSSYGFLSAFKFGWLIVAVFGGWFAVSTFSYAVGWVVRGFLDIPMNRDRRTNERSD